MNIWDFHLTGNISQNSIKYNHSRLKKHILDHPQKAHFRSSTIDLLCHIGYITFVITLQILMKPAIAGGAEAPLSYYRTRSYSSNNSSFLFYLEVISYH